MDLFITLLIRLGLVNGKTFDKAIKRFLAADAYPEKLESQEKAKADAAAAAATRAQGEAKAASEEAERATRVRQRIKEFVA